MNYINNLRVTEVTDAANLLGFQTDFYNRTQEIWHSAKYLHKYLMKLT